MREADFDISSDGSFIVTSWHDPAPGASVRGTLVRIDMATAQRATIADDPNADLELPGDLARRHIGGIHQGDVLDPRKGAANHAVAHALR